MLFEGRDSLIAAPWAPFFPAACIAGLAVAINFTADALAQSFSYGTDPYEAPVIEFDNLSVEFMVEGRPFRALRDCSFTVNSGEAVALVGESGSGKTTAARAVLGDIGRTGAVDVGRSPRKRTRPLRARTPELGDDATHHSRVRPAEPGRRTQPGASDRERRSQR